MNRATRTLALTLGTLAGIMGIEHGIGELLQGSRPTDGVFILSWPDSQFFEIMSGEPAMTIIPNYLITGLLAILLSGLFLAVLIRYVDDRISAFVPLVLVILMLLSGGGFGPPIVGIIATLIALKLKSPLASWQRLSDSVLNVLSALWPWSYGVCLAGWLLLFPGAALIAHFTSIDSPLLMIVPILIAFVMIPVTLLLGFSRDVLARRHGRPRIA